MKKSRRVYVQKNYNTIIVRLTRQNMIRLQVIGSGLLKAL